MPDDAFDGKQATVSRGSGRRSAIAARKLSDLTRETNLWIRDLSLGIEPGREARREFQ